MVIDSSALMAILLQAPEAEDFARAITLDPKRLVNAVSVLESAIVLRARKGAAGVRELDLLLHAGGITVVSFDADQALKREPPMKSTGRAPIPPASIWGTAAPMRWRDRPGSRCCSREMIFR